jgi:hypothetical protein
MSKGTNDQSYIFHQLCPSHDISGWKSYLVEVDGGLPVVVSQHVKVSHTDLTEVTGMVFIHVCSVVMLTTSKTTTTGMLAVLSYTTVTSRHMAAVFSRLGQSRRHRVGVETEVVVDRNVLYM